MPIPNLAMLAHAALVTHLPTPICYLIKIKILKFWNNLRAAHNCWFSKKILLFFKVKLKEYKNNSNNVYKYKEKLILPLEVSDGLKPRGESSLDLSRLSNLCSGITGLGL